ncbi:hypothetical protein TKK_0001671 [Trichogramma kaykai]
MVRTCFICRSSQENQDPNRSFHQFPSDKDVKKQWLDAIDRQDLPKYAVICSDHFTEKDFYYTTDDHIRRRKHPLAVPSQNLHISTAIVEHLRFTIDADNNCYANDRSKLVSDNLNILMECSTIEESPSNNLDIIPIQKAIVADDRSQTVSENLNVSMECSTIEESPSNHMDVIPTQEAFDDFKSEEKWLHFKNYILNNRKDAKTAKQKINRLEKRVRTTQDFISNLRQKNFLTAEGELSLQDSIEPGVKLLIESALNGKKFRQFPEKLKNFAMTLHFYSPSGYEYVRSSFNNLLPHKSVLREWLRTYNYKPGISREALQTVENFTKNAETKGKKLCFNLEVDEMSIRRHASWNKSEQKFEGYIDLGGLSFHNHESEELASNAIVFMLVCINGYFKIPVAYCFLIEEAL